MTTMPYVYPFVIAVIGFWLFFKGTTRYLRNLANLFKNDLSNPSSESLDALVSMSDNSGFVFSYNLSYNSRSYWFLKEEPSVAKNDFFSTLLNKYTKRNTIASNIKKTIAINVISIIRLKSNLYPSRKRNDMGIYHMINEYHHLMK